MEKGWRVFKHHNSYVAVIDDERKITTSFDSYHKEWSFDTSVMEKGIPPFILLNPVVNFQQFKECFARAAEYLGEDPDAGPKAYAFKKQLPCQINLVSRG